MSKFIGSETTYEDVTENPAAYGLPTFQEFVKMRSKWIGSNEEVLESVDAGSKIFKKGLKKFRFEFKGYRCDNLPQVEKIAIEHGLSLKELDFAPEFLPQGGGEAEILVRFFSKTEKKLQEVMDGFGTLSEEEKSNINDIIRAK